MYDPFKDHGGYKGRKTGESFAVNLMLGGLIVGGSIIWDKLKVRKQKKLWNNGFCAKCGQKWNYHWYYPKGSQGQYKYLAIDCFNCKIHEDHMIYIPEEIENPNKK